ncbi:MAG: hypothetical protein K2M91_07200 [Lachnospiraceae bacterium]|nr:hypothetical protein [Lachnospiraceae bacterium]
MTLGDIGNIFCTVFFIGFWALLIYNIIPNNTQKKRYMEEQIQTGRDKQRMLNFMQIVMKEYYNDFTYAVGNNKIWVSRYQVNYYPYIVCFNESDIVIISYAAQNGALICRNVLPIDWSCMCLKYRVRDKGVKLVFQLGKTKMHVNVNRTVVSEGSEKSDTPLGVVQDKEVDQLIRYLPYYKQTCSGKGQGQDVE